VAFEWRAEWTFVLKYESWSFYACVMKNKMWHFLLWSCVGKKNILTPLKGELEKRKTFFKKKHGRNTASQWRGKLSKCVLREWGVYVGAVLHCIWSKQRKAYPGVCKCIIYWCRPVLKAKVEEMSPSMYESRLASTEASSSVQRRSHKPSCYICYMRAFWVYTCEKNGDYGIMTVISIQ